MNYNINKLENSELELIANFSGEEVIQELKKIIDDLRKDANIPGFRKGKIPNSVIIEKFKDHIGNSLGEKLFLNNIENISKKENIKIYDFKMDNIKLNSDKFDCTYILEEFPEAKIDSYKEISLEKEKIEVSEEEVNTAIDKKREESKKQKEAEKGYKAKLGDIVDIAFEGFIDNIPFQGGKSESHELELGSKQFIDNFEEQLVGYEESQEGDIKVTFPKEYQSKDLAGKEAIFKVRINKIKKVVYPEIDDEFAKDFNYENLADMKNKTKESLLVTKEKTSTENLKTLLLEKLSEKTEINLPKSMIEREVMERLNRLFENFKKQGIDEKLIKDQIKNNFDSYKENMTPEIIRDLKNNFILTKISELENIEVTDDEYENKIEKTAKEYNLEKDKYIEKIKEYGPIENFKSNMKASLKLEKTITFLLDNSNIINKV